MSKAKGKEWTGYFAVTIDTEEEGLWSGGYPREGHSLEHMRELPRLQALFDKHRVKPVYFVDYPIVKDSTSRNILKHINDSGLCEIGAHVHPWCNPPFEEKNDAYHSYLSNLLLELQKEKIRILTNEIEQTFGNQPLSFRAGRFGFNGKTLEALESQGYLVDSSVTPYKSWKDDGGPSFLEAPVTPYFPKTEDVNRPGEDRKLLELPVSVGFNRIRFEWAHSVHELLSSKPYSSFHLIGILNRLGMLQKIFLSPEQCSLEEMITLSKVFSYKKVPILVIMFHSTSISPGKTPYVRNKSELEQFYSKLDSYLDFLINELKLRNCTLIEFRREYLGDRE